MLPYEISIHIYIHCFIIFFWISQEWIIESKRAIVKSDPISYNDNIEMAGKKVAEIITYDVDSISILSAE